MKLIHQITVSSKDEDTNEECFISGIIKGKDIINLSISSSNSVNTDLIVASINNFKKQLFIYSDELSVKLINRDSRIKRSIKVKHGATLNFSKLVSKDLKKDKEVLVEVPTETIAQTSAATWIEVPYSDGKLFVNALGELKRPGGRITKLKYSLTFKTDKFKYALYSHALLANLFIDNPRSLDKINFKDGNKFNINLSNMYWSNRGRTSVMVFSKQQINKNHEFRNKD